VHQVGLAEEVGDELGPGQVVEDLRGPHLFDLAQVHHRDRVGHGHGLLLVVGDVHEGQPDLGLDPLELDLHLSAQLEVQAPKRFVEQEHLGVVDQGPSDCDALLLATGQLGRLAVGQVGQLHQRASCRPAPDVLDTAALGTEGDVVEDLRCGNSA
jgi:hypothetical protein